MNDRPGFYAPGFFPAPPTGTGGASPPFVSPGFFPPGFLPPSYTLLPEAAPPLIFTAELATWLAARLGSPIYPGFIPQGETDWPILVYNVIDRETPMNLNGAAGITRLTAQMDAYSPSFDDAEALQGRLYRALCGYRGSMGLAFCQAAIPGRSISNFTPNPELRNDEGTYRSLREYELFFTDPAPIR